MTRKTRKMSRQEIPVTTLAILLTLTGVSAALPLTLAASAQTAPATAFPPPTAVPQDTIVRLNGSSSMANINQALAQRFKAQFPGTQVETATEGTEPALQAVAEGRADLAGIGRPLSDAEKSQGLVAVPVAKSRIAIIVGANNPFRESLTAEQFAQIFRGEIKNWSELGAPAAPIRLIDRPENSDIRQSLQPYSMFQTAPFQSGANAVKPSEDTTAAVIRSLGADGIGYAPQEQVAGNPNVRVLPVYGTLPTEAGYAFSQPLLYVYKGAPSAAVQAFLGYATAPENQPALEAAKASNAVTGTTQTGGSPEAIATDPLQQTADATAEKGLPGWLWLLSLPLVGGLLWWLFKEQESAMATSPAEAPARQPLKDNPTQTQTGSPQNTATLQPPVASPAPVPPIPASLPPSRVTLTPRNATTAYVNWEVSEAAKSALKQQGGEKLKLRIYDVTSRGTDAESPRTGRQYECGDERQDMHVQVPATDRDYVAELGYLTGTKRWLSLAKSAPVRFTSGGSANAKPKTPSPDISMTAAPTQTPISSPSPLPNGTEPIAQDPPSSTSPTPNGTEPIAQNTQKLISQNPSLFIENPEKDTARETAHPNHAMAVGGFAVAAAERDAPPLIRSGATRLSEQPIALKTPAVEQCQIVLEPRGPHTAYAHWEIPNDIKAQLRQQGGKRLVLRIHDATSLNIDYEPPHSTEDYPCQETDRDKYVTIPESDRDYVAEIGYFTEDGRWLKLIRSLHIRIPKEGTAL